MLKKRERPPLKAVLTGLKRERRPSMKQKESLEVWASKRHRRLADTDFALEARENCSVCEMAERRALQQCRKKVSAMKRKLAVEIGEVKGKRSGRPGNGEEENGRQEENERPSVKPKELCKQSLEFLACERHSQEGCRDCEMADVLVQCLEKAPAVKRKVEVDLTMRKTSTQSGCGEEENERQEEYERQEECERQEQCEWQGESQWPEDSQWQEKNERQEYYERFGAEQQESLQISTPKRCRGLPSMKRMLEENEWRIKAKELEEKCSEVTKQLEEFRGAITLDKLPLLAPCKCHFFKFANTEGQTTYDDYVVQSSVQTFLRNVRLLRRLKLQRIGENNDNVQEHLAMVIDFVIELSCQTKPIHLKGRYAEDYLHHAVDFIKDTIPRIREGNEEKRLIVDSLTVKLVLNLVGKLINFTSDLNFTPGQNSTPEQDSPESDFDERERILVVMLSLAEYGYVGHRMLFTSSQQIAMVLERLQCMDPFDEGFSQIFENLFFMFHLIETLVAAQMTSWKEENSFGQDILEDWVTCHFYCKTILERRPTAWTAQFMIVLDSITEKFLEQLQCSAELEGHDRQDIWQKALVHLLASAASAVTGI